MGVIGEQKINWSGSTDNTSKSTKIETSTKIASREKINNVAINKLKKDMLKDINNLIINSNLLYELEPTTTLSSIVISLSLLSRELNKIA